MSGTRKKLYLGLLLVGAIAMGVDRFVFSGASTGPSAALADGPYDPDSVDAASLVNAGKAALPIPELPFPRGLTPIDAEKPIRDSFLPPTLRRKSGSTENSAEAGAGPKSRPDRVGRVEFVKRHRLNGIIGHEDKAMAIIDGAWLIIGRSLDGCLLVAASENEALFSCFDGQAIIRVITDPTQGND